VTTSEASLDGASAPAADLTRRNQILELAAVTFAASGFRTSLREIADACGILPGSLYHHFESKDALIIELVNRYVADLDAVAADAMAGVPVAGDDSIAEHIVTIATATSACAMRHRAAVAMTLFEPPSGASDELVLAVSRSPTAIESAMTAVLRAGQEQGSIRSGVDGTLLAHRLVYSMLSVAIGVPDGIAANDRVPELKARIMLDGLAVDPPIDKDLDRSAARAAADAAIASWQDDHDDDERMAALRAAARVEFARRGYTATTIRDIAATAGLSTGTVYRLVGSKDELLLSVMRSFAENITAGWEAVLESDSSVVEQLDALMRVDIAVLERFRDEFRIQLAGLGYSTTNLADVGWSFSRRLDEARTLLTAGIAAGDRAALALGRDSVLRGASVRS
jgi:AcrR family transcriptional regulator